MSNVVSNTIITNPDVIIVESVIVSDNASISLATTAAAAALASSVAAQEQAVIATTKASEVAASLTSAATSATNAATSATNAATSATNAANALSGVYTKSETDALLVSSGIASLNNNQIFIGDINNQTSVASFDSLVDARAIALAIALG